MKEVAPNVLSTSNGAEGHGISASEEISCGEKLLKVLPLGWKVSFEWSQIMFCDVQYKINKKKKLVEVFYNQNLSYWWSELVKEIQFKLKKKTPAKESSSPK